MGGVELGDPCCEFVQGASNWKGRRTEDIFSPGHATEKPVGTYSCEPETTSTSTTSTGVDNEMATHPTSTTTTTAAVTLGGKGEAATATTQMTTNVAEVTQDTTSLAPLAATTTTSTTSTSSSPDTTGTVTTTAAAASSAFDRQKMFSFIFGAFGIVWAFFL